MTQLLIVTDDPSEFDDVRALLGDELDTVSLNDIDIDDVALESGETFAEVAMAIASHAARSSGLVSVAEASGIFVDRLDGAPGVRSAQYANDDATDEENRAFLLDQLREADASGRSARLVSAVAVAHPNGRLEIFESTLEGVVADSERGVGGVGYEPIFELDDGMTIAELLPEQRDQVRPRALALGRARPFVDELLAGPV